MTRWGLLKRVDVCTTNLMVIACARVVEKPKMKVHIAQQNEPQRTTGRRPIRSWVWWGQKS
jgi:hypothetical protein